MIRGFLAAVVFLAGIAAMAGDSPKSLVLIVPETSFVEVYGKVGDMLVQQRRYANTAKARAWLLDGWCDYRRTTDSSVVKVYCDSFIHLEDGGIKLTDERVQKLKNLLKQVGVDVHVTEDPAALYSSLGLTNDADSTAAVASGEMAVTGENAEEAAQ